jgi:hypothetical protein
MMVSKKRATVAPTGKPATYQRGVGELLPTGALLVTQNVVQPWGCAPERMPWGTSRTKPRRHRLGNRSALEQLTQSAPSALYNQPRNRTVVFWLPFSRRV